MVTSHIRRVALLTAILAHGVVAQQQSAARDTVRNAASVLTWNIAQKESGFRAMETLFPNHTVAHGDRVHPLPSGAPLSAFAAGGAKADSLERFIAEQHVAGLLILQDGKIRLERYALGYSAAGRWTSFSVAKSLTSTLVGAAIKDGYIKSLDEPVTKYIKQLQGSAYDGVTVRQLLTMTSGVRWNEDYTDLHSDIARLYADPPDSGVDATVSYVRKLPRESAPGTKWVYKTAETNLIGVLVMDATGKSLADYLSEKIWRPYGMERDAAWMVDQIGHEQGGCCLSVSLHDYARFGQFILDSAKIDGTSIVPDGWLDAATHKQAETGAPGAGYGYQWWTTDDGAFDARGIFGQTIHFDPKRRVVIVINSAWPVATGRAQSLARAQFLLMVAAAVDADTQHR
jgi:CubicO group peptidase (beta-lactamase class C family)